ncbi:uncharacterized protein [Haliotis asinina]|uniref:uncharacterized protein n=1 Tax=Haliotis asinina TaxID=109174 RepID=UPI003532452A
MNDHSHQRTASPAAASRLTELSDITPSRDYSLDTNTNAHSPHQMPSRLEPPHPTVLPVCQEPGHNEQSSLSKTPPTKRFHFQRTSSPIRAHPCPTESIASIKNDSDCTRPEHRPRTSSLSAPSRPSHLTIHKSTYEESFHPETSSTPLCSRPPKPPARPPKPLKLQSTSHSISPDGKSLTNDAKQPGDCGDEPPALPPRGRPARQPADTPPERPPKSWVMGGPRESSNPPPIPPRTRRSQSADSVFRKREASPGKGEQRRTASEGESQKLIMEVLV